MENLPERKSKMARSPRTAAARRARELAEEKARAFTERDTRLRDLAVGGQD